MENSHLFNQPIKKLIQNYLSDPPPMIFLEPRGGILHVYKKKTVSVWVYVYRGLLKVDYINMYFIFLY